MILLTETVPLTMTLRQVAAKYENCPRTYNKSLQNALLLIRFADVNSSIAAVNCDTLQIPLSYFI